MEVVEWMELVTPITTATAGATTTTQASVALIRGRRRASVNALVVVHGRRLQGPVHELRGERRAG